MSSVLRKDTIVVRTVLLLQWNFVGGRSFVALIEAKTARCMWTLKSDEIPKTDIGIKFKHRNEA